MFGKSFLVLVVAAVSVSATCYQDIVQRLSGKPQFSLLVEAVQAAGLVGTLKGDGPFTVFAPTNHAFYETLGRDGVEDILGKPVRLKNILLYHVLAGRELEKDDIQARSYETALGRDLEIMFWHNDVVINDMAEITDFDICASNGVIHEIDRVLIPPAPTPAPRHPPTPAPTRAPTKMPTKAPTKMPTKPPTKAPTKVPTKMPTKPPTKMPTKAPTNAPTPSPPCSQTIYQIANSNSDFDTLARALRVAGLRDDLNGGGHFTVFAPTDWAFRQSLGGVAGVEAVLHKPRVLENTLLYHVIGGDVLFSFDIQEGKYTTLLGEKIFVHFWKDDVVINDEAEVVTFDICASNGVIHVIDRVLTPPMH